MHLNDSESHEVECSSRDRKPVYLNAQKNSEVNVSEIIEEDVVETSVPE